MRIINVDDYLFYKLLNLIDNGPIKEVIEYAKKERLYIQQINTWQRCYFERIKERLQREGLGLETIRPE
jgi:hypothetical protein